MTSDAPSVVGLMHDFNDLEKKGHKDQQALNGFISELSTFFENAPDTLTGFLTAIYDCDPDYVKRTRLGGLEGIPYPWFNWIAGTTPRWLGDNLGANAVEGGFVARILFVYSNSATRHSVEPKITPEFLKRSDMLTHDLAHILSLHGEFNWKDGDEGDAFTYFNSWYCDPTIMPRVPDNRTQGYFERKHIHLEKVAMLLSLCESDDKLIHLRHIERAKELLEKYVEPSMKKAFSAVGGNPYATDFERISEQIEMSGGMTMQDLVNANFHQLDQNKLEMTLASLVAAGRILKDTKEMPVVFRAINRGR